MRDVTQELVSIEKPFIKKTKLEKINYAQGLAEVSLEPEERYYYEVLSEITGIDIKGEYQLISMLKELSGNKKEYESVGEAVQSVRLSGYGIMKPDREEITLEEPQVIRQGNKYGVRIRASSPSVHLIRADIETEIAPIVGTEAQAEDLIQYIKASQKENGSIWQTTIFGKTVEQLVMDGIHAKLAQIGEESRSKLQDTMKRVVNESNGGLICIII